VEVNRVSVAQEEVSALDQPLERLDGVFFFSKIDKSGSVLPYGQVGVPDCHTVFTGHQTFDIYDVCVEAVCACKLIHCCEEAQGETACGERSFKRAQDSFHTSVFGSSL
jgi:hypothetical protein